MLRRQVAYLGTLLGPGAMWILLFFIIPSLLVVVYSFLERKDGGGVIWTFTLAPYIKLFTPTEGSPLINDFVIIFFRSFWWALLTTLICLLIGYPLAFFIAQTRFART